MDGVTFALGDAGYSSGGDLAQAMKTSSPFTYVTYLGFADATTAITGGAISLSWNGVAYSDLSHSERPIHLLGF